MSRRRWGSRYDDYSYYPKSVAREAKGGIKASGKRGALGGTNWWAKRWIGVLESFWIGARLGRGATYARKGQVLSIDVAKGLVTASVQGSRPRPYEVTIKIGQIGEKGWQGVVAQLGAQALYAAKLLAGEMPQEIESVFAAAKVALFPEKLKDIETDCSCPDWSNPCKHIAAVYYLLGEEFNRDPFLMFRLRGMDRDELLAKLDDAGAKGTDAKAVRKKAGRKPAVEAVASACVPEQQACAAEPLQADPLLFWGSAVHAESLLGTASIPQVAAAVPTAIGDFPLWRGSAPFLDSLEQTYAAAARRGLSVYLAEAAGEE